MPAYNAAEYIREAIDSILNQTFTNFEFVIINDGSTDATEEKSKLITFVMTFPASKTCAYGESGCKKPNKHTFYIDTSIKH